MGREPTASEVLHTSVGTEILDPNAFEELVRDADRGAVVTFSGTIRNHDSGHTVTELHYSAHPSAPQILAEVAETIGQSFPGVRIAVGHRIGELGIGENALVCAVAAAHRSKAFSACAALVDLAKERLPIWKEQHFTDGGSEWVGLEDHA